MLDEKKKKRIGAAALSAVTVLITAVLMIPFLWLVVLAFKTNTQIMNEPFALPESLNWDNFKNALAILPLGSMYKNTIIIVVFTQILCLVVTFMCSFALTRLKFRSRKLQNGIYLFLLSGLMIPTYILLFPIYRINIALKIVNKYLSVILPLAASSVSFNTLLFVGFLKGFSRDIEEAAIIDGCSLTKLCTYITIPLIKPVLATVTVFNVLYVWNEFPLEVTLIQNPAMRTISMGVSMFRGKYSIDYGGLVAGALLILVPQLIFYGFFQKSVVGGLTAGAVKG